MNIEVVLNEEGVMARGRNNYFVPKYAYIHDAIEGNVTLYVGSRKPGKTEPVMLRLTRKGLKNLVDALVYFLAEEDQAAYLGTVGNLTKVGKKQALSPPSTNNQG